MSFKYLLAFSDNFMIKLYFKCFSQRDILIDKTISSNQRSCIIKNISSTTRPTIMTLLGDSITSKITGDCYVPCFHSQALDIFNPCFKWQTLTSCTMRGYKTENLQKLRKQEKGQTFIISREAEIV